MSGITDEMVRAAKLAWGNGTGPTSDDDMRAALEAADRARVWRPTHQHRKGGLYRVIARGRIEADLTPCVIYDDRSGTTWVRPAAEFDDGRFAPYHLRET